MHRRRFGTKGSGGSKSAGVAITSGSRQRFFAVGYSAGEVGHLFAADVGKSEKVDDEPAESECDPVALRSPMPVPIRRKAATLARCHRRRLPLSGWVGGE